MGHKELIMDINQLLALVNSHAAGGETLGATTTIDDIWTHMATRHSLAESTIATYTSIYRAQVGPHFGKRLAMSVIDPDITDYRAKRRTDVNLWGAKKRPIRPASRNREISL